MFEARIGAKELSPPQKRCVFLRLQIVRYRPRRRRLKRISQFERGERMFLLLLVKIRSRFWSCQIFGMPEEGISAISAVCLVAGKLLRGLPNCRLPASLL